MSHLSRTAPILIVKPLAVLLLSLFSLPARAVYQSIQSLGEPVVNGLVYVVVALLLGLVIALILFKVRINARERSLAEAHQQRQWMQEQTDRSVSGVLQLDASGTILYANPMAAYFFERKIEQLTEMSFIEVCPEPLQAEVAATLAGEKDAPIACQLGHYHRHARIRITLHKKPIGEVAASVTIDDVEHYQQKINRQRGLIHHREQAMEQAGIGFAVYEIAQERLSVNGALAKMLELGDEHQISAERFAECFDSADKAKWDTQLKLLNEGQAQTFEGKMQLQDRAVPIKIHACPQHEESEETTSASLVFVDLSRLEQLKQQAEFSLKQAKAIMSASPLPVYLLDTNKQLVDCNQAFSRLFNVQMNLLRNKSIEDIAAFDQAFKALHAGGDGVATRRKSATITLAEDRQIDINLHLLAYRAGNEAAGTVAIIEDLTPLKNLEKQVSMGEERLNSLIEQSPLGVALLNEDDSLIRVNPAMTEILGKSADTLKQQTFYQLFSNPEQAGRAAKLLHQKGQVNDLQAELVGKDEIPFSTRLDVSRLKGAETEYICWVADSRHQRYLSDQLERLIRYSNMPVAVLGDDGFSNVNPAACAFFDVKSENELLGLSPASKVLNPSEQSAEEMAAHLQRLQQQQQVVEFSWVHQHHGDSLPCEITLVPLFYQQQHTATLCMWTDLRALERANEARLEAVNLRQAAEREIAEKQQLLQNSQDLLASRARSLQNTQEKLEAAETDLAAKMDTIKGLQQAHEDISGHLQSVQNDYERNLELLNQSQKANAELEAQLEESSDKVSRLQNQRNQIADALQRSERSHKQAQEKLALSEQATQRLKEEQAKQLASLEASQAQIASLKNSIDQKDKQLRDVGGQINTLQSQLVSSGQASEKLRERLANQRKASEIAEKKRRELELICQSVQSELENKTGYVEHLQHEMKMLEQMSQQQKGDMEKQTQQLAEELAAKQKKLDETEQQLSQAKEQSEQEKKQSAAREAELMQLKTELQEVEKRHAEQQQKINQADEKWQQQQAALQSELKAKQDELQQVTEQLNSTQQQTDEERAQQAALVDKLEAELQEVEQRATAQAEKIAKSEQQRQQEQQTLAEELAAKRAQLDATQQQLDEHQRQMDAEKLARKAQQDKLAQLKQEMADVESRASKQREMLEGSDEQWRQHHAEIEKQKQQLQQALEQAEAQNKEMQSTLASKLEALKGAESTVSKTQSDEQKLQKELAAAKEQAEALQAKLARQEEQEKQLQRQVSEQQSSLQQREDSIQALKEEQQRLTEALRSVKEEYEQSQSSLDDQNSSQQQLTQQLKELETELKNSKEQLNDKETALKDAQDLIASHASKLAEQENALIDAQKEELKLASGQQSDTVSQPVPEFAKLPMPDDPEVWFELLPYLQNQRGVTSLAIALQQLIEKLQSSIDTMDQALKDDSERDIQLAARKLIAVLATIPSVPLNDMAKKLEYFCEHRFMDNISIGWPAFKAQLMSTLRVIYSHLHA
ncbi:PAS domain-containing protein [Lacimicrobium sp. SS2-24]|uniref:PAS domain-containing protein n=1 Tax=Lacimicrobium sp. SS2-24 TaxID=2005569 RepID=UPI000B4BC4F9|nr:PAS domain-containing protein [Lacimicrobium sp. SS2-24]